mgnify:CR=1 FL=1
MAISGAYGKIYVKQGGTNVKIAEMSRWTLNLDVNDVDVTNFDTEGWVERLTTFKDWTASCEGNLVIGDVGQMALIDAYINGEPVTIEMTIGKPSSPQLVISGNAMMSLTLEASTDSQATFSADFNGMGALTIQTT